MQRPSQNEINKVSNLYYSGELIQAEFVSIELLKIYPDSIAVLNVLGVILVAKGQLDQAIKILRKVIHKEPNCAEAYSNLGNALTSNGQLEEAVQIYDEALKIIPHDAEVHSNRGNALLYLKRFESAIDSYNRALQLNPSLLDVYNNRGSLLRKLGRFEEAIDNYKKAINLKPNFIEAYNNIGSALQERGKLKEATHFYQYAIRISPNHPNAYKNIGTLMKQLGNEATATKFYEKAFDCAPHNLALAYQLSNLKTEALNQKLLVKINKVLTDQNSSKENIAHAYLLLSKYELKEGNYQKEFNNLITGHTYYLESKSAHFKKTINYYLTILPQIIEFWRYYESIKFTETQGDKLKPIFIVGVPRSGSTVVEKIIGSNSPQILLGEETRILDNFIQKENLLARPKKDLIREGDQSKLIEQYKQKKLIKTEGDFRFTDKSLENFFFIGLIQQLFPEAKIINCVRDPLSSIMSILQNNLLYLSWAHNLDHIFQYFENYHKILNYWIKLFPNSIYHLKYEDLVEEPEIETKRLMNFCELDWDEKCLHFYQKSNLVSKTASNMQIRRPLYNSSACKYEVYRPIMEKHMKTYHSLTKWNFPCSASGIF